MSRTSIALAVAAVAAVFAPATSAQCQTVEIAADDAIGQMGYGAATELEGGTLFVGAPYDDGVGTSSGSVYVLHREGLNWFVDQKLTASDAADYSLFGRSVAADGSTLVVGAPGGSATANPGAVYVFELTAGLWLETAKLVPSTSSITSSFGSSLALEGGMLVVGDPLSSTATASLVGSAHVFQKTPLGWLEAATLLASDGAGATFFGSSVAISAGQALVGSPFAGAPFAGKGAVYVYGAGVGVPWSELAKIEASDAVLGGRFGGTLAADDTHMFVTGTNGAPEGALYVFDRTGLGWVESQKLVPTPTPVFGVMGDSIDFDGTTVVVGNSLEYTVLGFSTGAAYAFRQTAGGWAQFARLEADDASQLDYYGDSVAVEGDTFVAGATQDNSTVSKSGSVYAHDLAGGNCGTLSATPPSLSLAAGGQHDLTFGAGAPFAGLVHLLVGSSSGTTPGTFVGALRAPLNLDAYTTATINQANQGVFSTTFGVLDASGGAASTVSVPAGTDPALAGVVLSHAMLVADPLAGLVTHVSNATRVRLRP